MPTIGGLPDGLILKREGETLFEFTDFWVLAKTIGEAEEKVAQFHQGQVEVRRFLEYAARPPTEEEIANQKRALEIFTKSKPRNSRKRG